MPAYMQEMGPPPKCKCGKKATHRVKNRFNELIGEFCKKCATEMVKRLNA